MQETQAPWRHLLFKALFNLKHTGIHPFLGQELHCWHPFRIVSLLCYSGCPSLCTVLGFPSNLKIIQCIDYVVNGGTNCMLENGYSEMIVGGVCLWEPGFCNSLNLLFSKGVFLSPLRIGKNLTWLFKEAYMLLCNNMLNFIFLLHAALHLPDLRQSASTFHLFLHRMLLYCLEVKIVSRWNILAASMKRDTNISSRMQ